MNDVNGQRGSPAPQNAPSQTPRGESRAGVEEVIDELLLWGYDAELCPDNRILISIDDIDDDARYILSKHHFKHIKTINGYAIYEVKA